MKRRDYLTLWFLGLAATLAIAGLQAAPGYMDADYYYATGMQIASGKGLTEPFLWNYLDRPAGLPHPAFTYWMPLPGLLAGAGMLLTGKLHFFSARLFFILLSSFLPPATSWLAYHLTGRRISAWMAGGLAVATGLYSVYLGLTESITLYMLLGTAFLAVSASRLSILPKAIWLGLLSGGMHLARADGILWLLAGLGVILVDQRRNLKWGYLRRLLLAVSLLGLVYGLVMGFWYARNLLVFHSPFPPGNSLTLWMVNYDQLYNFPPDRLTFQDWSSSGLTTLLALRWDALLANLQNALAVQGEVFLAPLILAGLWRLRQNRLVRTGVLLWALVLAVMTLIFPLAGARGGFLHSGAAFQPLFWAAAAEGLVGFVGLGVRWRKWKPERALAGFSFLSILLAVLLTIGVLAARIPGDATAGSGWSASWEQYQMVGRVLDGLPGVADRPVLVNNPPGFYIATGRPAIAIPNGPLDTLLAAARQYQAGYLVLEENTVKDLMALYQQPHDQPGLIYLQPAGKAFIFSFEDKP